MSANDIRALERRVAALERAAVEKRDAAAHDEFRNAVNSAYWKAFKAEFHRDLVTETGMKWQGEKTVDRSRRAEMAGVDAALAVVRERIVRAGQAHDARDRDLAYDDVLAMFPKDTSA